MPSARFLDGGKKGERSVLKSKIVDPVISQSEVKGLFDYSPETGIFTSRATGKPVGSPTSSGYLNVRLGGRNVGLHRVVFMWMYGHWPMDMVDHVNGIRDDNRLANVRPATATLNAQNRAPRDDVNFGYKGVTRRKDGRWQASIMVNGVRKLLAGTHESAYRAHQAYKKAARKNFAEFARFEKVPSNPAVPAHAQEYAWNQAIKNGLVKVVKLDASDVPKRHVSS